ncbi:hypothetical protein ANN_27662 [Periplaneta americana]|uniref:Tc1-like transposase DDE domain-containing protein n=1 Tax=Periplaneta americana TaxID=6978 RepID=A0ABQ8RWM3_PERAM|nr:hypothetical protein ANN_27662 [Periplaneta americana]
MDGALLMFTSKQKSGDFHDDMNYANFSKGVSEMLLPNIPPQSVIVLDNASYHNVQENRPPTMSPLKIDMKEWVFENKKILNETGAMKEETEEEMEKRKYELLRMTKKQLFNVIQGMRTSRIDQHFTSAGHTVQRLRLTTRTCIP